MGYETKIRDYTFKEIQLSYAAGFIDGEGCISMHHKSTYCTLYIGADNTVKAPLDFIASLFGGHINTNKPRGNRKVSYRWRLYGIPASEALEKLLPYFIVKKQHAKLGIGAPYATPRQRKEISDRFSVLNKTGKVE